MGAENKRTKNLGISPEERITLSAGEVSSILSWLRGRSLHFGQSAYLALEALLSAAGISFTRVDVASRLILTDILTGTLTPIEGDDLVLSVYAMQRVAAEYGLQVTGYKMTYDALKAVYESACSQATNCSFEFIAHIDGNHYIIVTKVTDAEVSYIDPAKGPETQLDQFTLSKEAFLEVFAAEATAPQTGPASSTIAMGYVISGRAPPVSTPSTLYSVLSSSEQMSIRGAFFGFIKDIFKKIFEVVKVVVTSVIHAVRDIVVGIVKSVWTFFEGFGELMAGLFTFNGDLIMKGLKDMFVTSTAQVIEGFTAAIQGSVNSFDHILEILGVPESIQRFIHTGEDLVVLGTFLPIIQPHPDSYLSPKVTQVMQATGKIIAGVTLTATGNPLGLTFIAGGTADILNRTTTLSPEIKNVISISAASLGAFAGGFFDASSLAGALAGLKSALPYLSLDLASAGLVAVGHSLGIDPRLTALISVPVRAAAGGLTGKAFGIDGYKNVISKITKDTLGGLISVAANIGLNELQALPIASSFIRGFLGSIAAGLAGGSAGGGGPGGVEAQGQSILSKIGEGLQKFGRGIVKAVGNVISFGQKVIEGVGSVTAQGFKKAISAFSSIFSRQTQEGIYADETGLRQATVTANGDTWTWQSGTSRIDYNTQTGEAVESFGAGGSARITGLGKDEAGNTFYQKLTHETAAGGGATLSQIYDNGSLTEWSYGIAGTHVLTSKCRDSSSCLDDADVEIRNPPIFIPGPDPADPPRPFLFDNVVLKLNIFQGKIAEASGEARPAKAFQEGEDKRLDKALYVLVNGIDPDQAKQGYMHNLQSDLATQSRLQVNPIKDVIVPLVFEPSGVLGWAIRFLSQNNMAQLASNLRILVDVLRVIKEQKTGIGKSTQDVQDGVRAFADSNGLEQLLRPMVGVAYSGGFVPLVEAAINEAYNVASFVALGGTTLAVGALLARAIVGLIQQMEKIATARDQVTREAYKTTFGVLGAILRNIPGGTALFAGINLFLDQLDGFYDALNPGNFSQKVEEFYEGLRNLIKQMSGYTWGPITSTNAGLVVNIWGTQDVLAKLGVTGYRDAIGGYSILDEFKPLFNIEIEGADHFDYVYGIHDFEKDFPDQIERQEAIRKNGIVSKFVARLILKANDAGTFRLHMTELKINGIAEKAGDNSWKIKIL